MNWYEYIYAVWFGFLIYACVKGYIGRGWFYIPERHCCHKEDK